MKILFLDIDGVLNHQLHYQIDTRSVGYPLSQVSPVSVEHLNKIVAETGCKVVISSTWRHSGIDYCRNVLNECGFKGEIIDITPDIHANWSCRGNEILSWQMNNDKYKYDSYRITDHDYAILDDDSDMLYQQRNNFFECNAAVDGLNESIANSVIQFLNCDPVQDIE